MTVAILGVVMLDTRFPRLPGDIGNPATFAFPGALSRRRGRVAAAGWCVERDRSLLAPFIAAAQALEAEGCAAIATSCGFLALFQHELQAAVGVPVWTSSLLLVAELQTALPAGRRVGVVTADAASLTPAHLAAAGAAEDSPIEGLSPDSAVPLDPARQSAGARRRPRRGGDRRRGAAPGEPSPGARRDRPRMHQHAALR